MGIHTPARGYVNIPNLVYKSLDVRYTIFFYIEGLITNFLSEMTLGHVVTLPLGQVVTLLQWSR